MGKSPYISERNASLLEHLWLVIVVDLELGKQNLVFISGKSPLYELAGQSPRSVALIPATHSKGFLCLLSIESPQLDKRPKTCVVQVVDMACILSAQEAVVSYGHKSLQSTCLQLM